MNVKFENLFELAYQNDYYQDKKSVNFDTYLSTESQSIAKNLRLLFRKVPGGGVILYDSTQSKVLEKGNGKIYRLTFFLYNKDQSFYNFTDIPQTISFFYYSNKFSKSNELEAILVQIRPFVFDQPLLESEQDQAFELLDNDGNVILNGITPKAPFFKIDLQGEAASRYRLQISGQDVLDFYTYNQLQQPYFGAIEIYLDLVSPNAPAYQLPFTARTTFWQYLISFKKAEDYQLSICRIESYSARSIKCEATDEFCLSDEYEEGDMKTLVFTSRYLFPFEQRPNNIFGVKINRSDNEDRSKPVTQVLPNPNTSSTLGAKVANPCNPREEGIISKMYIYL
ncbi:MAG: hypothetical protein MI974_26365 [Chitinophagales bacterium]|nr:hypothetical protein [Chitinophagales bacterium]